MIQFTWTFACASTVYRLSVLKYCVYEKPTWKVKWETKSIFHELKHCGILQIQIFMWLFQTLMGLEYVPCSELVVIKNVFL